MKSRLLLSHSLISLLTGVGAVIFGFREELFSIGVGCIVIGLNLIFLFWSFERIILKKSIALAVSVIVLKYAILVFLGCVLFLPETLGWNGRLNFLAPGGFAIGLCSVLPTVLLFSFLIIKQPEKFQESIG